MLQPMHHDRDARILTSAHISNSSLCSLHTPLCVGLSCLLVTVLTLAARKLVLHQLRITDVS
ncbi:hypothetical protein FA95DRAFT_1554446 [Auriscalpium vulgare]|uniref:Uncharacterized protein n=1 Tax=Auriscalpium vulgare TaxID=40419 RepID=A0ACB8S673_9AGAM|nr:hypothetical protein FA95DRAFT_1554446 [Auriscalpium vulgare]